MELDINELYMDRFIISLEEDIDLWKRKDVGASTGETWSEWDGPSYTNEVGETITFGQNLLYTGCWINGRIGWTVGFWRFINPFSKKSRRLRKALRNMKYHVNQKRKREHLKTLKKSL
jgi:hypothetical protein